MLHTLFCDSILTNAAVVIFFGNMRIFAMQMLYIRNYDGAAECSLDYIIGDVARYYSINVTEEEGEMLYTGLLSCTTTVCKVQVSDFFLFLFLERQFYIICFKLGSPCG